MTITLHRSEIAAAPVVEGASTALVLEVLRDALFACAEPDLDMFHSTTPAGRAAISLAGLARSAVAALGEPGPVLHDGPGVVVIRDLAQAVILVEVAAAHAADSARSPSLDGLAASIGAACAALHETIRSGTDQA
jgi:hypothetical protein